MLPMSGVDAATWAGVEGAGAVVEGEPWATAFEAADASPLSPVALVEPTAGASGLVDGALTVA